MRLSTHRHIQIASLMDKAINQRIRYYNNAQRAGQIGARMAAVHFIKMAQRWEQIRQRCALRLIESNSRQAQRSAG